MEIGLLGMRLECLIRHAPTHPFRGISGRRGREDRKGIVLVARALVFEARRLISPRERQETPVGTEAH